MFCLNGREGSLLFLMLMSIEREEREMNGGRIAAARACRLGQVAPIPSPKENERTGSEP